MAAWRYGAMMLVVAAVGAFAAGCGGSGTAGTSATTGSSTSTAAATSSTSATNASATPPLGASASVAAEVPASLKAKGAITVAMDATFPPFEFIGGGGKTIEGIDADLSTHLARVMGLKVKLVNAKFDTILPGLAAGDYNIGMSGFNVTKAREQVMDFVNYAQAGNSYYVNAHINPATVQRPSDLCGKTIAVLKGSTNATTDQAIAAKCSAKTTVLVFPDQSSEALAVASGRADVGDTFGPVSAYLVSLSNRQMKLAGENYDGSKPIGIAIPKGSGLTKPLHDAMKVLIADGTYQQVMAKWHAQKNVISDPLINGATS